jgi:2-dehydro-3-deoxygluconokinase
MSGIVTFGEIMLRLSPSGHRRFGQARAFDAIYGGGEANVAASLAVFGEPVQYVTRLPQNPIGDACLNYLRQYGIGTDFVVRGGERLGIYFLEIGAAQRGSQVVYDRAGSALALIQPGMVDWDAVFAEADWFHWTGITPAISEGAAEACHEAVQRARANGLVISCDLNYRSKLWRWGKPAGEVMAEMVALCDIAVGNEEDAQRVFGIEAPGVDVTQADVDADAYASVCETLAARFPRLRTIAITLRGSLSASHNTWSAVLWRDGEMTKAPTYDIRPIVDRVGGGDSFVAGLIHGLRSDRSDEEALSFATAASCLKHTIVGDFNLVSVAEVERLMGGDRSGRVSR